MGKKEKEVKRVVLDTNVLISGLLFDGEASKIVRLWQERKIIPVICRQTFEELRAVLQYPKFALTKQEILNILEIEVLPYFEVIENVQEIQGACRDPEDDQFLACALSAEVEYLVTGDRDLADLKRFRNIQIVTIAEFLHFLL